MPGRLGLAQIITFYDVLSGFDPGHKVDETLILPVASFSERFVGQQIGGMGDFATVSGPALSPLTLIPGAPGQTLSILRFLDNNMLNGYGPAG